MTLDELLTAGGRSGMAHQIDNLANDLSIILQLIRWLFYRCKGTENEQSYETAISLFLGSGNKAVVLFGVLIRETKPNEYDLKARGQTMACSLQAPTICNLLALYIPCAIAELPAKVLGGKS